MDGFDDLECGEVVDASAIGQAELMDWNEWQSWRKEFGGLPKGAGASDAAADVAALWVCRGFSHQLAIADLTKFYQRMLRAPGFARVEKRIDATDTANNENDF